MIGIYAIYRKSDNKCMYVGQSKDIRKRVDNHFCIRSKHKFNRSEYYYKIIEQFDYYDIDNQLNKEAYYINILKPELNIVRNRHFNLSEESKKKISEFKKGKPSNNKGKHFSEYTRKKLSEAHKGQVNWKKGMRLNKSTGKYEKIC